MFVYASARLYSTQSVSQSVIVQSIEVENRKIASYDRWFRFQEPLRLPHYFSLAGLTHEDVVRIARFRLGSHFLRVEKGRFSSVPWADRWCLRCSHEHLSRLDCKVDDAHHLLFDCERFSNLRDVELRLAMIPTDLLNVRSYIADFEDLRVCKCVSLCMKAVDDEEVALHRPLQAEQPTG